MVRPPDTGALLGGGLSARDVKSLWDRYYAILEQDRAFREKLWRSQPGGFPPVIGKPEDTREEMQPGPDSIPVPHKAASSDSFDGSDSTFADGTPEVFPRGVRSIAGDTVGLVSERICTPEVGQGKVKRRRQRRKFVRRSLEEETPAVLGPTLPSPDDEGYGYLRCFLSESRVEAALRCGVFPSLRRVLSMRRSMLLSDMALSQVKVGLGPREAYFSGTCREETSFTTVIRSVPVDELGKAWREFVRDRGVCTVPGVRSAGFRLI